MLGIEEVATMITVSVLGLLLRAGGEQLSPLEFWAPQSG